jgi:D-alanyl-D-alanine carboxypeptidase
MKTGFTCGSGYNLVATATRGGKRLIAVVLGAKSSTSRAVKAAQLFERGFATDPPGSVMLTSDTVDSLAPVAATPPDLRADVCEHSRRHRAAKESEEGGEAEAQPEGTNNPGDRQVVPRPSLRGAGLLTAGLAASIPPVEVYTGPVRDDVTSNASIAPTPTKQPPVGKQLSPFRRLRKHSR